MDQLILLSYENRAIQAEEKIGKLLKRIQCLEVIKAARTSVEALRQYQEEHFSGRVQEFLAYVFSVVKDDDASQYHFALYFDSCVKDGSEFLKNVTGLASSKSQEEKKQLIDAATKWILSVPNQSWNLVEESTMETASEPLKTNNESKTVDSIEKPFRIHLLSVMGNSKSKHMNRKRLKIKRNSFSKRF